MANLPIRRAFQGFFLYMKSMIAAAVAAIGIGQAAAAAVVNYDIQLRYDGTKFRDVSIWSHDSAIAEISLHEMALEGNPYGVIGHFSHLQLGDIVRFAAEIIYPDDPEHWIGVENSPFKVSSPYPANLLPRA